MERIIDLFLKREVTAASSTAKNKVFCVNFCELSVERVLKP